MKKLLFIIALVLLVPKVQAADCVIDGTRWSVSSVATGQSAKAQVLAHGCTGFTFSVSVYKLDPTGVQPQNRMNSSFDNRSFNTQGTLGEVLIPFDSAYFDQGNPTGETESVVFVASANGQEKTSSPISFTKSTTPPAPGGGTGGTGGGAGTQPTTTNYNLEIQSPANFTDLVDLVNLISTWIFNISIPVAVIIIIYAGLKFLLSRGVPAEITAARQMLTYAIVGLAIVLIGKGFVSLVTSIIDLGNSSTPTTQSQGNSTGGSSACNPACSANQACVRSSQTGQSTVIWKCI